jgi:hypothetical protein
MENILKQKTFFKENKNSDTHCPFLGVLSAIKNLDPLIASPGKGTDSTSQPDPRIPCRIWVLPVEGPNHPFPCA